MLEIPHLYCFCFKSKLVLNSCSWPSGDMKSSTWNPGLISIFKLLSRIDKVDGESVSKLLYVSKLSTICTIVVMGKVSSENISSWQRPLLLSSKFRCNWTTKSWKNILKVNKIRTWWIVPRYNLPRN